MINPKKEKILLRVVANDFNNGKLTFLEPNYTEYSAYLLDNGEMLIEVCYDRSKWKRLDTNKNSIIDETVLHASREWIKGNEFYVFTILNKGAMERLDEAVLAQKIPLSYTGVCDDYTIQPYESELGRYFDVNTDDDEEM